MADEITFSYKFAYEKGNIDDTLQQTNLKFDVASSTPRKGGAIQNIGTSLEALVMPSDIGTAGWMVAKNLDATNYLEIGIDSSGFVAFIRLDPGDVQIFKLAVAAPYARANTAACDLEYIVYSR